MNKIAYAALLIAVSLGAQTVPAAQETAHVIPEVATQVQTQPPPAPQREQPYSDEALKKLRELGYFTSEPFKPVAMTRSSCAIPLLTIPVQDKKRFAGKIIPANSSIDPKIVVVPPLPVCPQNASTITVSEPAVDKK